MTRKEILKSVGYWTADIQIKLYETINRYLKSNEITKTSFAQSLGVSKGYITQVLNGDFNHKISKLVQLSLASNKVPIINFVDFDLFVEKDFIQSELFEINNKTKNIYEEYSSKDLKSLYGDKKVYSKNNFQTFKNLKND